MNINCFKKPRKLSLYRIAMVFGFLLLMGAAVAQEKQFQQADPAARAPAAVDARRGNNEEGKVKEKRIREGTRLIGRVGYFKDTGDGAIFRSSDGMLELEGLKNLALVRIGREIDGKPDQLLWSITGMITEYRGTNFLLVTRAILKAKTSKSSGAR